jgi:hypothetical protein
VDYVGWGRYPLNLKHAQVLTPDNMVPLTAPEGSEQIPHDNGGRAEPQL